MHENPKNSRKIAQKSFVNFKPSIRSSVSTGFPFAKYIGFSMLSSFVGFEMHCGKRDGRHLFLYGGKWFLTPDGTFLLQYLLMPFEIAELFCAFRPLPHVVYLLKNSFFLTIYVSISN